MTKEEQQLIISSYLGDSQWIRQKRKLRIKFGGYCKSYIEYKHSLITTMHKSKIWGSVNRKNILYEFTVGGSNLLDNLKESSFWEVEQKLDGISDLGLALLIFDDGTFHKSLNYYVLCIGKEYSYKFAKNFEEFINNKFSLHSTRHKHPQSRGYNLQFKTCDTSKIATILTQYSNHDYTYKIPPPETIAKYASRYKDIPKDLGGKKAYDIVRSSRKLEEK